ncbi:MAG: hypothetical protein M0036_25885 [Desulfobacteraceae bacterium]|nr:hypothetical protein [Desulfobacteraceae bacterium]
MAKIIDLSSYRVEDEGEICPVCSIELEQLATDLFICPSCNHVVAITEELVEYRTLTEHNQIVGGGAK